MATVINRAADCSIRTFISCKFNHNLSVLIVSGEPSDEELTKAFEEIETEFNDLSGNRPAELKLYNQVNALTARNAAVHWYFFAVEETIRLANVPLLDALPKLKKQGVNIKWKDDIEDFKVQVQNAKIKEQLKHVQLEELQAELDKVTKLSTQSASYDIEQFYRELNALEAHGYKISETETNMARLAVMRKDFIAATSKLHPN